MLATRHQGEDKADASRNSRGLQRIAADAGFELVILLMSKVLHVLDRLIERVLRGAREVIDRAGGGRAGHGGGGGL